MALDFIGGAILIAVVVVNISVFTDALGISQPARIGLVAAGGLWTGLQVSLYAAGASQSPLVQTIRWSARWWCCRQSLLASPPSFRGASGQSCSPFRRSS